MSNRTVEKIFCEAYHVVESYECFKILIVGEYGSDFSASQEANHAAFREHMQRNDIRRIIDIFDEAAKELELPLGEIDREEFFTVPLPTWTRKFHWSRRKLSDALLFEFPCLLEFRQIARL